MALLYSSIIKHGGGIPAAMLYYQLTKSSFHGKTRQNPGFKTGALPEKREGCLYGMRNGTSISGAAY
jgi:hypothetical protein